MNRLKAFWSELSAEKKRQWVLITLLVVFAGVAILGYWSSRGSSSASSDPVEQRKDISLEPKMLEKSLVMESQQTLKKQGDAIVQMRQQIEDLKKEKDEKANIENKRITEPPVNPTAIPRSAFPAPPPPPPPDFGIPPAPPSSRGGEGEARGPDREILGEISVISNPYAKAAKDAEVLDKKKDVTTIYLPPSFMEATLLTGLDAETVESARGNPEPVLLRIRDLAVLPNQIKTNLKGCFVIAQGYGKLSKERVELRLVTLSCLAKNGEAVIDQAIKGFVADEDGKNGLSGNVVSKMGSAVARAALAAFFGGAGDAFRASANTTSISPLGATQLINPGDVGKAAVGGGLAGGSHELERLYLELARQATPIIEVGATKTVTLIITEGVELKIKKDLCIGGQTCEK